MSHTHLLRNLIKLEVPYSVLMPNGCVELVHSVGECQLNEHLHLKNVLLIPNFKFNLLFVAQMVGNVECVVQFTDDKCIVQDRAKMRTLGIDRFIQGLYMLPQEKLKPILAVRSNNNEVLTWHKRLGHISFHKMTDVMKVINHELQIITNNIFCDICPMARQIRMPFTDSVNNAKVIFELLHTDVWGPFKVTTMTGARYFLTIVDDHSRSTWTYLMVNKAPVSDHLIRFITMVETQFEVFVKTIRSDNGSKFLSAKLHHFLSAKGCVHQTSCSYTPQQNGRVERKHRHLLEIATALKIQSQVPDIFWDDCILIATYVINRVPLRVL